MKVYCVYWSNGMEDVMSKIFSDAEKARKYVKDMRKITEVGWYCVETEVAE